MNGTNVNRKPAVVIEVTPHPYYVREKYYFIPKQVSYIFIFI